MQSDAPANPLGLLPIVFFVVLVIVTGLLAGSMTAMPILVAFLLSAGLALGLNRRDEKLSLSEKLNIFCRGSGERNIMLLVFIFLLAGAFYALTIDIGARDATVNLALRWIPADLVLPGLFLICCFISFAMGTSMGTITALSPVGAGLATSLGIPVPMALGIVVGGAMFGDNLSFVSDTTIAATRSQGVRLADKFKANLIIALPAALVTMLLLVMVPVSTTSTPDAEAINGFLIVPYLVIIISALAGLNVIAVLGCGIATAALTGLATDSFTLLGMLTSMQKGLGWMQDLAMIAITIGGIVALMHAYGGIRWLITVLTRRVSGQRGAEGSIAALVSFLDVSTANNTIAIVTAGPVAKELSEQYNVDPRRTASLLDVFSCGFQGLVPYGAQLLSAAAVVGISPLSVTLYSWYPMLILVFGVLAILSRRPRFVSRPQRAV
ncbi:Na+/H+ antiporter NhaC family protein [Alteromonas sp. ASW11-19]|uniref:Na+/H+ antiporter NhaC family protein n=1 Tax=Alteromonas salexigens TaxID=2982530 RepID=A0ABT2VKV8_9ALTE|nr:Na+/H+ antiporter NhaC family protein [Alteromonas salexigens]MCU7553936.1 Na+/H+ antiporter NhaC family protein [Alteromonas salexigens]